MPYLHVTFSRAVPTVPAGVSLDLPIAVGRYAASERLDIGSDTDPHVSAAASADDYIVELLAEANCWVEIGENPSPSVGGATSRKLLANERLQYWVLPGDKVGVRADAA